MLFNVLLTCSGRRNYLVKYFQEALGDQGRVFVADCSPYSATMIEANGAAVTVPSVRDPAYFDTLLAHCQRLGVRLLVPLNDFELPSLARQAGRFRDAGIETLVSSPEVVDLCFDKWLAFQWLRTRSIPTPETTRDEQAARAALDSGSLRFPVVVKPRWGSGSIGVEFAASQEELDAICRFLRHKLARLPLPGLGAGAMPGEIIVQQAVEGIEYGLDIVNDLDGRHQAVLSRRKLTARAGETDRALSETNELFAALGARLGQELKHRGIADCDAILTADGPTILELNPRFGGGYPFSHAAGANVPAALIAWAQQCAARPEWLASRPGVLAAKCDRLVHQAVPVG